MLVEVTSCL